MATTLIRDIRKRRGLTLQQLADRVGTTAQTIQRLETDNMSVSVEWLRRIGDALTLTPCELLSSDRVATLAHLGDVQEDGSVRATAVRGDKILPFTLPKGDKVAVRMTGSVGPYPEGAILIAERLPPDSEGRAHGRDCLVALDSDELLLRRVMRTRGGTVTLRSISGGVEAATGARVAWMAPVTMTIRYHD